MNPSAYDVWPQVAVYRHVAQSAAWLKADGWLRRRFLKTYARQRLGTFRQLHPLGRLVRAVGVG